MGHSFVNGCKMYHSRSLIKLRHQSTAQSLRLIVYGHRSIRSFIVQQSQTANDENTL